MKPRQPRFDEDIKYLKGKYDVLGFRGHIIEAIKRLIGIECCYICWINDKVEINAQ